MDCNPLSFVFQCIVVLCTFLFYNNIGCACPVECEWIRHMSHWRKSFKNYCTFHSTLLLFCHEDGMSKIWATTIIQIPNEEKWMKNEEK